MAKELTGNLESPEHKPHSRKLALDSSARVSPIPPRCPPTSRAASVELGRTVQSFRGYRARKALGTRVGGPL